MPTSIQTLEAEALKLPTADRTHLLERLVASLDIDPDVDQEVSDAWTHEADRRVAELDSGAVIAVPGDETMRRRRARLG